VNDEWDWHQFCDIAIWQFVNCVHWRFMNCEMVCTVFEVPVLAWPAEFFSMEGGPECPASSSSSTVQTEEAS
jgi:hypothetical protein